MWCRWFRRFAVSRLQRTSTAKTEASRSHKEQKSGTAAFLDKLCTFPQSASWKKTTFLCWTQHGGNVTAAHYWLHRRFYTISAAKKRTKVNHLSQTHAAVEKNCSQGWNNPPPRDSQRWLKSPILVRLEKNCERKEFLLNGFMSAYLKLLQRANHEKAFSCRADSLKATLEMICHKLFFYTFFLTVVYWKVGELPEICRSKCGTPFGPMCNISLICNV